MYGILLQYGILNINVKIFEISNKIKFQIIKYVLVKDYNKNWIQKSE